jgi:hypothetical protein
MERSSLPARFPPGKRTGQYRGGSEGAQRARAPITSAEVPSRAPMRTLDALLDLLALDRLPRTGLDPRRRARAGVGGGPLPGRGLDRPRPRPGRGAGPRRRPGGGAVRPSTTPRRPGSATCPGAEPSRLPAGAKRAAESAVAGELLGALSGTPSSASRSTRRARRARPASRACATSCTSVCASSATPAPASAALDDFAAGLSALDCAEFPPCAELQRELLPGASGPGVTPPLPDA